METPFEHKLPVHLFCARFVLSALIGVLVGGGVNRAVVLLQKNSENSRAKCFTFLSVQLVFISIVLFISIYYQNLNFYNWFLYTYSGYIAGGLFFTVQTNLSTNATCLLTV